MEASETLATQVSETLAKAKEARKANEDGCHQDSKAIKRREMVNEFASPTTCKRVESTATNAKKACMCAHSATRPIHFRSAQSATDKVCHSILN